MRHATTPWMLAAAASSARRGPVVTPTRLPGVAAALRRLAARWQDALRGESLPHFDAATLRDLGLSHAAIAGHGADPHAGRRPPLPH